MDHMKQDPFGGPVLFYMAMSAATITRNNCPQGYGSYHPSAFDRLTVVVVYDSPLTVSLNAVVTRALSMQMGVRMCCSLPPDEAMTEARQVLVAGLQACTVEIDTLRIGQPLQSRQRDALLLLAAERYWIDALLNLLVPLPEEILTYSPLDQVLAAFPRR
jgi:hypothetical protein